MSDSLDNSPTGSQPSAIAVVTGVTGSVEQQPTVIQKKKVVPIKAKFPVDSPKKINFGPPKPPRHFDYVALSAGNSSSQQQQTTPAADRKAAAASSGGGQRKLSPRQLFDKLRRDPTEERSPVLRSDEMAESGQDERKVCYDNSNSDLCDEDSDNREKQADKNAKVSPSAVGRQTAENLYVRLGGGGGETEENVYAEAGTPLPPDTPPPPLPVSLPPSAEKANRGQPMVTMYENVWIDGQTVSLSPPSCSPPPAAALPTVPPRSVSTHKCTQRTGKDYLRYCTRYLLVVQIA